MNEADESLVGVTFDLIIDNRFDLARELLDFAVGSPMKHASEQSRLILTVNRAQAYKWSGDSDRCTDIIAQEDWSACGLEFQLAVAVLSDEFQDAASIMRRIGPDGPVSGADYQEWPLFREFSKTQNFMEAYAEVFGEPFVHTEKALRKEEEQRRKETLRRLKELVDREALADEDDAESAQDDDLT